METIKGKVDGWMDGWIGKGEVGRFVSAGVCYVRYFCDDLAFS